MVARHRNQNEQPNQNPRPQPAGTLDVGFGAVLGVMDSRFNLKAKFSIYGEDYDWDASLNWSAEPGEIDRRITEWFLDCHDKARMKYDERNYEARERREAEETKARELADLERLKAKYPDA